MPTAILKKPRRLNAHGRIWERGVAEPVSLEMAALLEDDERFQIKGFAAALRARAAGEDDEVIDPNAPKPLSNEDILAAIDLLDIDNDDSFLDNGLPNAVLVSEILEREISQEDIEKAMNSRARKAEQAARATQKQDAPARDRLTKPASQPSGKKDASKDKGAAKGVTIKRIPRDDALKTVEAVKAREAEEAAKAQADAASTIKSSDLNRADEDEEQVEV